MNPTKIINITLKIIFTFILATMLLMMVAIYAKLVHGILILSGPILYITIRITTWTIIMGVLYFIITCIFNIYRWIDNIYNYKEGEE